MDNLLYDGSFYFHNIYKVLINYLNDNASTISYDLEELYHIQNIFYFLYIENKFYNEIRLYHHTPNKALAWHEVCIGNKLKNDFSYLHIRGIFC